MGHRSTRCCCGPTTSDCCFYSERQDPDSIFVTIPSLGWDLYHHPKTYDASRYHDREGYYEPLGAGAGYYYLDPHFDQGLTVECNWINSDWNCNNSPDDDRIELCNSSNSRGFPINFGDRYYISDLILGDIQEAHDVAEAAYSSELSGNDIFVTACMVIVYITRKGLLLPPFGSTNIYADGCAVTIEFYSFNLRFPSPFGGSYRLGQDFETVAEATAEMNCYYDLIVDCPDYISANNPLVGSCLQCQRQGTIPGVAPQGGFLSPTPLSPSHCKPVDIFAGAINAGNGNVRGGGLCYGYLPTRSVNPTLPNRFIPLYSFLDLQSTETRQFYHSYLNGSKDDFAITW